MSVPKLRFSEFDSDWKNVTLGSISKLVTSGSRDWAQHYSEMGSKFIRMTNLSRDRIDLLLDDMKYVDVSSNSSDGRRTSLIPGDILMSITAELGKIGIIPDGFGEAYINQHTALIRLNEGVNPRFIAQLLGTKRQNKKINKLNDAGAKAGLNLPTIKSLEIAVPEIEEQKKIAKFLSNIDQKISHLTRKHALLIQYKKGVMRKIFNQEIRFKDEDGKEFPQWIEYLLGDICEPRQHKTISGDQLLSHGFPVYGANGLIGYYDSYNHELETVAVTCRGATCGEVTLVPAKSWITGNSMSLDNVNTKKNNHKFIYYAVINRGFKDVISGSAQPQIVGSAIKSVKLTMPKIEEQAKIAKFLSSIDDRISLAQSQITLTKKYKQGLLQQMFI